MKNKIFARIKIFVYLGIIYTVSDLVMTWKENISKIFISFVFIFLLYNLLKFKFYAKALLQILFSINTAVLTLTSLNIFIRKEAAANFRNNPFFYGFLMFVHLFYLIYGYSFIYFFTRQAVKDQFIITRDKIPRMLTWGFVAVTTMLYLIYLFYP